MEKRIIRRPILIAAAGIAGVLTLLAGYVESQAAAKFELEVASVSPQPLADDQAEASASTRVDRGPGSGALAMAKARQPVKVHSAAKANAETASFANGRNLIATSFDDVFGEPAGLASSAAPESRRRISERSESTELPVDSHVAAEISRNQSKIPAHADIESLKLLAGAQERFALGLRVRLMQYGTVIPGHAEKSDGD